MWSETYLIFVTDSGVNLNYLYLYGGGSGRLHGRDISASESLKRSLVSI